MWMIMHKWERLASKKKDSEGGGKRDGIQPHKGWVEKKKRTSTDVGGGPWIVGVMKVVWSEEIETRSKKGKTFSVGGGGGRRLKENQNGPTTNVGRQDSRGSVKGNHICFIENRQFVGGGERENVLGP